jgi:hypothetical protein
VQIVAHLVEVWLRQYLADQPGIVRAAVLDQAVYPARAV